MCRFAAIGLLLVGCLATVRAEAQDGHPVIGVWHLNAERSVSEPGPPNATDVYRFVETGDGFILFTRITIDVTGEPRWAQGAFRFDGQAYPVYTRGSLADFMTTGVQSPAMRVFSNPDPSTILDAPADGSAMSGTFSVSSDRETLTVTRMGTDGQGQAFRSQLVFDRVQ